MDSGDKRVFRGWYVAIPVFVSMVGAVFGIALFLHQPVQEDTVAELESWLSNSDLCPHILASTSNTFGLESYLESDRAAVRLLRKAERRRDDLAQAPRVAALANAEYASLCPVSIAEYRGR